MNDVTLREQPMHGARHIWAEVQADLKSLLGDNAHRSWTARLSLHSANDSVVRLIAPSKFAAGRIVNDYGQTIQTLWAARDPRQVIVGLAADFADANTAPKPGLSVAAQSEAPKPADDIASPDLQIASPQPLSAAGRLRDARTGRFTFDNFVVGATNELADLLIIDDAHFIADKPGSQEELLHTLISLVGDGRQVMLATDRHPHAITKASDRLKSYMCAGTPRDLEGAFNQVVARSEFLGKPLTLESVQEALNHSRYNNGMRPTVDKIQKAAAKQFGITMDDMLSKRRARAIARPRQAAMYLAKTNVLKNCAPKTRS